LAGERGLTLLEVVIALMLFALMSVLLLEGQGRAADSIQRVKVEREMAELLSFRINMVALQHEDYEDGETGQFPASGVSERLIDELEIFGDLYPGYTWSVEMEESIGSGASQTVRVDDSEPRMLLFEEEGSGAAEDDEEVNVGAEEVDRMLFLRVTVYPPGYDESLIDVEGSTAAYGPRSAWTAIFLPQETEEE
jgi:prepilin-type N-terminal cleavage/methylation domain-containing protein